MKDFQGLKRAILRGGKAQESNGSPRCLKHTFVEYGFPEGKTLKLN